MARITITRANRDLIEGSVNGIFFRAQKGKPCDVPDDVLESMKNMDIEFVVHSTTAGEEKPGAPSAEKKPDPQQAKRQARQGQ